MLPPKRFFPEKQNFYQILMMSTSLPETISPSNMSKVGFTAVFCMLLAVNLSAQQAPLVSKELTDEEIAQLAQPDSEYNNGDVLTPTYEGGYYPTIEESLLLGGDYARRADYGNAAPDNRMQTASGLYPSPNPGQLDRAPWAQSVSPLNPFLGFFAPRQALVYGENGGLPSGAGFTLDAQFPLLVRDFSPERAMFKAGGFYLDLISVGMTVLHSDYQGARAFPNGSEDGWLMGTEFSLRALAQITDQFYFSLVGTFVYLPLDNRLGFALGSGGSPNAAAILDYQTQLGTWDVRFYDQFLAAVGSDIFTGIDSAAHDRAGRYRFGFDDRRNAASGTFNGDNTYFSNALGFDASAPTLWDEWLFQVAGRHLDVWRTSDFDNHSPSNQLAAILGYSGTKVLFRPSLQYIIDEYGNEFEEFDQRLYLNLVGRLAQTVTLSARVGRLWRTNDNERYLYGLSLRHQLSSYTSHVLSAGQDYFGNDITGENIVASYVSYEIDHAFSRSLSGSVFVQFSKDDSPPGPGYNGRRTTTGGQLDYALFGGTNAVISLRSAYERREFVPDDSERWIWNLNYSQQLASRMTANVFYQYEESVGPAPEYNEHLIGTTIRKYF